MPRYAIDLTDTRLNSLVALRRDGSKQNGKGRHAYWIAQCDCGNIISARSCHLLSGGVKSCGCLRVTNKLKHGQTGSTTYLRWSAMMRRVVHSKRYAHITVCAAWREFSSFFADMGECPEMPRHTLDRIDNSCGYWCGHCRECKGLGRRFNCRWATYKQQARNQKTNRLIIVDGETRCLAEWAEKTKIPYSTLWNRLNRGMSMKEAICA